MAVCRAKQTFTAPSRAHTLSLLALPEICFADFDARPLSRHAPPAIHGRRVRIRYMTQPKSRPPTFALFGNQLKALPDAYLRYLTNGLREAFHLEGTPIRMVLRTSKNPFANEK